MILETDDLSAAIRAAREAEEEMEEDEDALGAVIWDSENDEEVIDW